MGAHAEADPLIFALFFATALSISAAAYTAIDRDVVITGSEVEHSIVLAGSSIRDLDTRMEASLLGKDVSLSRSEGLPKTLRFLVGDNADISIP